MGSLQQTKLLSFIDKINLIFTEPNEKDHIKTWKQDLLKIDNN
jgi:hypothetical protein